MRRADRPNQSRLARWAWWILLAMVGARGIGLVGLSDSFRADPDAYRRIAWTLDQTGTFGLKFGDGDAKPTAYRPPLYPWLLSWLVTDTEDADRSLPAFRVGCLHLGAFAMTLVAVFGIGCRLLDQRSALAACLLVTLDPLLIRHSALVMTETIAVMLTSLATWLFVVMVQSVRHADDHRGKLQRFAPWGVAVLLAVGFLCRPTFLVWAGLLTIVCWWKPGARRPAFIIAIVMAMTIGCWTMRNIRSVGHPVWATTHGGYTMLLSNNRFFYDYLRDGWSWTAWDATSFTNAYIDRHATSDPDDVQKVWKVQSPISTIRLQDGEVANDRWAGDLAKATIRENPSMFVWASVVRVMRLWSPIPLWTSTRSTTSILLVSLFYGVIYFAVAFAIVKHRACLFQFSWIPIWTLAAALTMVHCIYWTNLRMRCPVQPGIALVAAAVLVRREDLRVDS